MTTPQAVEYREIVLTKGQVAKVSPHRFEELNQFKWQARWSKRTQSYYAQRNERVCVGRQRCLSMHRQILGLKPGDKLQGDHRNHDTLDNTDGNLRVATRVQQQLNKRVRRKAASGLKGVTPFHGRFQARIGVDGKSIFLGSCKTAEEASMLYLAAAEKLHGEFACLSGR